MNVVLIYLRMYGEVLVKTAKALVKSPWTLALPMVLSVGFTLLAILIGALHLGIVGGFITNLLQAAAISAYLYFTGEVVAGSTTSFKELRKSFGVFFSSVISVFFVIWVAQLVLGAVLPNGNQSETFMTALSLVALIALNAAPETIYVKGTRSGIDTIVASFKFLQEQLLLWLVPNGLLLWGAWYAAGHYLQIDLIGQIIGALIIGAIVHVVMVFRGVLYVALDGSTHRQRMFKYRNKA